MRSNIEILEEYNTKVERTRGAGIASDLELMTVSNRIMIEVLLDIREAVNKLIWSPLEKNW